MKRQEKIAEAVRLRAERLTYQEIGARLGVAHSTVGKWLDPERAKEYARRDNAKPGRNETKRAWEMSGKCSSCGEPCLRTARLCRGCANSAKRAEGRERTLAMMKMRREGALNTEIAEVFGLSPEAVADQLQRRRVARYGIEWMPSPHYVNAYAKERTTA